MLGHSAVLIKESEALYEVRRVICITGSIMKREPGELKWLRGVESLRGHQTVAGETHHVNLGGSFLAGVTRGRHMARGRS